jgi:hypothetical protein
VPRRRQNPKLEKRTDVSRPFYFIRVTAPETDQDGNVGPRKRKPVHLGFLDEISRREALVRRAKKLKEVNPAHPVKLASPIGPKNKPRPKSSGGTKPGPKSDSEGHIRIAELLAQKSDWYTDLEATCQLLTNPPDGKPSPKISRQWSKKYNVSTYAEAFRAIAWIDVHSNIERRIYQGKCLNGTMRHRETRPKRIDPRSYGIRELRLIMCTYISPPETVDRNVWREMIRKGLFEKGIILRHVDLVESIAKETLKCSQSPVYVKAWNITPELAEACQRVITITSKVPWKTRHPEARSLVQKILDG